MNLKSKSTTRYAAWTALPLAIALAAGCGKESNPNPSQGVTCDGNVCTVAGTITEDLTFTKDKQWVLRGGVFIGDDVEKTILTVEPGTTVFGETSTLGMLVIRRNSEIHADGTAAEPIVFTSAKPAGSRARGDWGGIILNGNAPVNGCDAAPCESFGEGGTGFYGGDDPTDNSGTLRYVRVEFAGRLLSPDNELNGIAFQGVGSGTTVDYIQVHMNKDDGVEFFGGNAEVKHIIVTGAADDSIDWTDGWQGKIQFAVAQQYDDASDNGIEADNNAEDNEATPRSMPTLSNITLIGSPDSESSDLGMLLREGTGASIHNVIVTGFNDACIDVDDDATFAQVDAGNLVMNDSIISCATNFKDDTAENTEPYAASDFFDGTAGDSANNTETDPQLGEPYALDTPDYKPATASPALGNGVAPSDSFFDNVDYIGAMDDSDDWTAGWTTHELN